MVREIGPLLSQLGRHLDMSQKLEFALHPGVAPVGRQVSQFGVQHEGGENHPRFVKEK